MSLVMARPDEQVGTVAPYEFSPAELVDERRSNAPKKKLVHGQEVGKASLAHTQRPIVPHHPEKREFQRAWRVRARRTTGVAGRRRFSLGGDV